jgi:O-antigen ligase
LTTSRRIFRAATVCGIVVTARIAIPPQRTAALLTVGLLAAAILGAVAVLQPIAAVGLLIGGTYLAIALVNLPLAIVLWLPVVFLEAVEAGNLAGKAAGLVLLAAWAPGVLARAERRPAWFQSLPPRIIGLSALLVAYLSLSLLWAPNPGAVLSDAWHWLAVALLFALVASSAVTPAILRALMIAFVVGAVISVFGGSLGGGFHTTQTSAELASAPDARLGGAIGDPNFLAAGLVPAIVIAAGLAAGTKSALLRLGLIVASVVLTAGVVLSESRGGAIALLVTVPAAMVCFRRRRTQVSVVALGVIAAAALWFSFSPGAWQRVTTFNNGGNGRTDLWTVAWRVAGDHPVLGVGLDNYASVAFRYVREPGTLTHVQLVADQPHVVHNTYLQMLAEGGIVGLTIFLAFIAACLATMWHAARTFGARGDRANEALAQAVLVGAVAMLTAAVFISAGVDKRLWIILAFGPALDALARKTPDRGH